MVFSNSKINTGLRENLFSYALPEGAPVFHTANILKAMVESLEDEGDKAPTNAQPERDGRRNE